MEHRKVHWLGELSLLRLAHVCVTVALAVHALHDIPRHRRLMTRVDEQQQLVEGQAGEIVSGLLEIANTLTRVGELTRQIEERTRRE